MCHGANAREGLSDCKTPNSACAAQDERKGQERMKLSARQCAEITRIERAVSD